MTDRRLIGPISLVLLAAVLAGCSSAPPKNLNDSCAIFSEKDDWYDAMQESQERWGVPIHVQLAILYQESRFRHDAKPPRDTLLWVIPWFRQSSAYGYAQVKDGTWDWYRENTGNGGADRDDLEDAVDFIGWYGNMSHRINGISKWDAYNQYLAYHEGHGGFRKGSYREKRWLMKVARQVKARASRYHTQLTRCEEELKDSGWWPF